MTSANFNTSNDNYRKLQGNGLVYRIPRFQRDYSWGEEEWEDLWQDILGTLDPSGESAHYMGYLVLQTKNDKDYSVIDGQQRLTTLSLIVLSGMRVLKMLPRERDDPERNRQRLEQLRASYVGYLDPVTLVSRSKLTLNRNNDEYYQRYLVTLEDRLPERGYSASVQAMRKAFEWFERKHRERISAKEDPGVEIARFIESMSDKLFFTVITVADELNAYKVFETLNARGVRLSSTDLLKNYLFSILAKGKESRAEMDELEKRWESMVGRLGSESFPDFLRTHWNSREAFARQSELFKVIRNRVKSREHVFQLLRAMDDDIDTYLGLTQPEGSQWERAQKDSARELKMFSVRQPFPLLMAARRRLDDAGFERVLKAAVVISFRYNVIGGQNPSDQEKVYHAVALRISNGDFSSADKVIEALRPIYIPDVAFRSAFSDKVIKTTSARNNKVVRYILCELERQEAGAEHDIEAPGYSVEHILPQSPEAGWEHFRDADLESFIYRIGNMAMLESAKNRRIGNGEFSEKVGAYRESVFLLTREIASSADWTPEQIASRQRRMANLASTVWKVSRFA